MIDIEKVRNSVKRIKPKIEDRFLEHDVDIDNINSALTELELYKEFVNEFNFEIVQEHNSNDYENWDEEYLDIGGATDKAIEIFKIISKVGEKE